MVKRFCDSLEMLFYKKGIVKEKEENWYLLLLFTNVASCFMHFILTAYFYISEAYGAMFLNLILAVLCVYISELIKIDKISEALVLTNLSGIIYVFGSKFFLSAGTFSLFYLFFLLIVNFFISKSKANIVILFTALFFSLISNVSMITQIDSSLIPLAVFNSVYPLFLCLLIFLIKEKIDYIARENQKSDNDYYWEQIYTDPLTELYNRRYANDIFKQLEDSDNGKTYLAIVDIDNFKRVNDVHGHLAGDKVLKAVASSLKNHVNKGDVVIRWGGEEFLIIVSGKSDSYLLFENLREKTSGLAVYHNNKIISVTVTIGIAEYEKGKVEDTLRLCDYKLYKGKSSGKNKVVV